MEFQELILKRQSDRKYLSKPVEQEKILKCIEAARLSPSGVNSQPWTFVVVEEDGLRKEVQKAAAGMGMNNFVSQAPVIIAIVLERPNIISKIGSVMKDKEYPLIDIGIAANQFCLQAADIGLGTCMIGWFDEKKIKKLLDIPSSKRIPILITLGYSDARLREKTRKPIDKMYKQNKY